MIANIKGTEGYGAGTLKKVIHAGSESIMFSVLQETQYMYPFKSSVREIVSNCLDSITERNNALKILNGELKVEDLYIEKEGSEMADSGFNPDYYDPKWLSDDDNVYITYIENDTAERDRIMFKDNGVGLGGTRLINYFSLGFSSKRKSKNQLGSFGLGAKSLLATGVDFYTVTSAYNGKIFSFNIYKDHIESAIPKFEGDVVNKEAVFFEGTDREYRTFYRETNSKNFVVVECDVKRFRKNDFITSIENQLGYIDNIELIIKDNHYANSPGTVRSIKQDILVRQGNIIVGSYSHYAVPQIVLKPGEDSEVYISYGPINFDELEMPRYSGNVCFILNINEVDVTPSRESVIWNNKTREAIKTAFIKAQEEAQKLIKEKISSADNISDFYYQVSTLLASSETGLSELYKIINRKEISIDFDGFDMMKGEAALKRNELTEKGLIFSFGYAISRKEDDWKYENMLSTSYFRRLSSKSYDYNNTFVFIADKKLTGIGRFIYNKYSVEPSSLNLIFVRKELYEKLMTMCGDKSADEIRKGLYKTGSSFNIILAEVIYFIKTCSRRVIHQDDLTEEEEALFKQVESPVYKSAKELNREKGLQEITYSSGGSRYRKYLDIEDLPAHSLIYQLNDPLVEKISFYSLGSTTVGLNKEQFKAVIANREMRKANRIKLLRDEIFELKGGDLRLTALGVKVFGGSEFFIKYDLKDSIINYLCGTFKSIAISQHGVKQSAFDMCLKTKDQLHLKYSHADAEETFKLPIN